MLKTYGVTEVECAAESPDELAFLRRIADDLSAPLPKLVFADWLEERGDPRGPFLRKFVEAAADPKRKLPPTKGMGFNRPWLDMVGVHAVVEVRKWMRRVNVSKKECESLEARFLRNAVPRVHLIQVPLQEDSVPAGETKYGGSPDLPPGEPWPVHVHRNYGMSATDLTVPGVFCAQIRLSDLQDLVASDKLPSHGLLSFFYYLMADRGCGLVRLSEANQPLRRTDPPPPPAGDDYLASFYPLPPSRLRLVESVDLRVHEQGLYPVEYTDTLRGLELSLWPDALVADRGDESDRETYHPAHQLLGYGQHMNCYPHEDELRGFRRLITFGSGMDGEPGVTAAPYWGDSAQPFFYIREDDLAVGRFDRVVVHIG